MEAILGQIFRPNPKKKIQRFFLEFCFFEFCPTIPHISSEIKPPPPIINAVWKYLGQFLGTSFGAGTLPTLISGEEADSFLESGPFHNFQKLFLELTWSQ